MKDSIAHRSVFAPVAHIRAHLRIHGHLLIYIRVIGLQLYRLRLKQEISQAVKNPGLISEGARIFGNQCIVLGMDAKRDSLMPSGYRVYINGSRTKTDLDALEWAKRGVELGAGEIVLNSIDADGTKEGYEIPLTKLISENVSVPVIASGGGGTPDHLKEVLTVGKADGALIASMVHSGQYTIGAIKQSLVGSNIPVRI